MNLANEFLSSCIERFNDYKTLGEKTFAQLSEEEFLLQPNDASNSIAIIIQHMHGNMLSRWTNFLAEDGEKPWRKRDEEFVGLTISRQDLMMKWEEGWKVFLESLASLKEDDLLKTITIRSEPLLVVDAISRQMAHYSYHVGQIVYLGRWIRNGDWKSLSIPKGNSATYNDNMEAKRM